MYGSVGVFLLLLLLLFCLIFASLLFFFLKFVYNPLYNFNFSIIFLSFIYHFSGDELSVFVNWMVEKKVNASNWRKLYYMLAKLPTTINLNGTAMPISLKRAIVLFSFSQQHNLNAQKKLKWKKILIMQWTNRESRAVCYIWFEICLKMTTNWFNHTQNWMINKSSKSVSEWTSVIWILNSSNVFRVQCHWILFLLIY